MLLQFPFLLNTAKGCALADCGFAGRIIFFQECDSASFGEALLYTHQNRCP